MLSRILRLCTGSSLLVLLSNSSEPAMLPTVGFIRTGRHGGMQSPSMGLELFLDLT